jgi:hypothetical protein
MTTLQEAARKSFEAWKKTGSCFYLSRNNAPGSDLDGYQDAYTQGQWVTWQAALAQQGQEPETVMIDAAMVEMANIHPPLKRSECQRLIRAALSASPKQETMVRRLLNIADGVRMYGAPDKDLLADRIAAIASELAAAPAPQAQEPAEWRTEAVKWIRRKAEYQRATNEQNPRHAEAYPSWGERVRQWHWLADDLELEQNSPPFGLEPYQEPAPQPAQGEQIDRSDAVNLARNVINESWTNEDLTRLGVRLLADAVLLMDSALQSAQPVAPLSDDEILTIAHRKATRYTHAVAPWQVTYGFSVGHMVDFVRAIEAERLGVGA